MQLNIVKELNMNGSEKIRHFVPLELYLRIQLTCLYSMLVKVRSISSSFGADIKGKFTQPGHMNKNIIINLSTIDKSSSIFVTYIQS